MIITITKENGETETLSEGYHKKLPSVEKFIKICNKLYKKMNVYLDPSIEEQIRQRIDDRQIFEINVNIYGIIALYNKDGHSNFQEIEIYWDEMR